MKKTQRQKRQRLVNAVTVMALVITAGHAVFVWPNSADSYSYASNSLAGGVANVSITALFSFLSVTIGIGLLTNILLGLLFVRESRLELNEGFYSEDSWLDVEDKKLVMLNDHFVAMASLKESQIKTIAQLYQSDANHNELIALLKTNQLKRAVLADITALHSRHDEDLILLAEGNKEIELSFLNHGTKAHALDKLEAKLPLTLVRNQFTRSRLRSAMPRLVILAVLLVTGFVISNVSAWFVIGLSSVVFIVPTLISRLISPTVLTTFELASKVVRPVTFEQTRSTTLPVLGQRR